MILYSRAAAQSGVRFHDAEAQRQIQAAENQITSYEVYPIAAERLRSAGEGGWFASCHSTRTPGRNKEDFSAARHQTPVA
jgi:hypothetical protein